ncbi:MAG: hypothetical protein ABW148_05065 [Sedimenticola sp.]
MIDSNAIDIATTLGGCELPMPLHDFLKVAVAAADALQALHADERYHGDIRKERIKIIEADSAPTSYNHSFSRVMTP